DPLLRHENDLLVVRLDLAIDDLADQVLGLAALAHLLLVDPSLFLDRLGRNTALVDGHGCRAGDVQRELFHELLELRISRYEVGLAIHFDEYADLAVVVDVAADLSFRRGASGA